jgi:biopolymer transport protein ExbD
MPLKTHQEDQPTLNLTPMIDVVFLLIIFFMVGTKFTELERKIQLEVPEVSDVRALTSAPEKRVINVYRDGSITIDREVVSLDRLLEILHDARRDYPGIGVLIRGDADGPFQNVASVLGTCRRAGISEMGISVRLAGRDSNSAR